MLRFIDCSTISSFERKVTSMKPYYKVQYRNIKYTQNCKQQSKIIFCTYICPKTFSNARRNALPKKKCKDYLIQVWFCSRRRGRRRRRRFLSPGRGRRTFSDNSHRHGTNLRGRRPSACLSHRTSRFVCGEEQTGHVTLQGRTRVADLLPVQRREGGRFAATGFRRPSHRH